MKHFSHFRAILHHLFIAWYNDLDIEILYGAER